MKRGEWMGIILACHRPINLRESKEREGRKHHKDLSTTT